MMLKLVKLCSYAGLPFGGLAFIVCLAFISHAPTVPHPERGLTVPFRQGRDFLYTSPLMHDAFYLSSAILALGILCTIILAMVSDHERRN